MTSLFFIKLVFTIVGSATCFFATYTLNWISQTKDWQATTGTVTHFEPYDKLLPLTYSYSVAGVEYEGRNDMVNSPPKNHFFQEGPVSPNLKVGQEVTVWYDPHDPRQSCLDRGSVWASLSLFVFGAFFFVPGAFWGSWRG